MSAWSGIVVAAIALSVVVVAAGGPMWEWKLSDTVKVETWSYGLFGATHTVLNKTLGTTTVQAITYSTLPGQQRMVSLFLQIQEAFLALIASIAAAMALSVVTLRRKLRGMFAGAALVSGCLLALLIPLDLVLGVTAAAEDLPQLNGNSLPSFEGFSSAGGTQLAWGPNVTWYLLLGLCILLAFGASEVWSLRPTRRPAPKAATTARLSDLLPPPPPAPDAPEHLEPAIEEVFVIGANGLLIKHMSRTLMSEKDRDVVGGMISVLSNFVREAFSERDGNDMQEVTLGDHRFILCNERGIVVAVLVTRGATEDILPRLRHLLACLIDRYASKLDSWGGEPLEGIEDEIEVLWHPFFLPPPPVD
jgi:hypothetical protein